MKVHFVRSDLQKRTFWVSASKEETLQYLSPLMDRIVSSNNWKYWGLSDLENIFSNEDLLSHDGETYFSIADDLSLIEPFFRVFPISNMWNGGNPWCRLM